MDKVKYIVIGTVAFIVIFVILLFFGIVPGLKPRTGNATTVVFWGLEDKSHYEKAIADFSATNPQVNIEYTEVPEAGYEKRLLEAFATQTAPDIFMIENTWLPRYLNKIVPAPSSLVSARDVRQTLVPAAQDFVVGTSVYGLPYTVDTLALFYNDAILKSAGFSAPPKDWDEFVAVAKAITRKDLFGGIALSGAALGTAGNVNYAPDIAELLMLQSGVEMTDPQSGLPSFDKPVVVNGANFNAGAKALEFYTSFANSGKENYSWNGSMPDSLEAFTSLKTAMIFGYSDTIATLRANYPKFAFKTSEFPQPKNVITKATIARYQAPVVWSYSRNQDIAWQFLKFLVDPAENAYYTQTFEKPTSLLAGIDAQKAANRDELLPFVGQNLTAQSFYEFDNNEVDRVFSKMIDAVVRGGDAATTVAQGAGELQSIMNPKQ